MGGKRAEQALVARLWEEHEKLAYNAEPKLGHKRARVGDETGQIAKRELAINQVEAPGSIVIQAGNLGVNGKRERDDALLHGVPSLQTHDDDTNRRCLFHQVVRSKHCLLGGRVQAGAETTVFRIEENGVVDDTDGCASMRWVDRRLHETTEGVVLRLGIVRRFARGKDLADIIRVGVGFDDASDNRDWYNLLCPPPLFAGLLCR